MFHLSLMLGGSLAVRIGLDPLHPNERLEDNTSSFSDDVGLQHLYHLEQRIY
jgi:hypothetical protein